MKPNTCLVLDVWEGQLELDEPVLKSNGVAGLVIRLNDMNSGHHMDAGFTKQWAEASNFVRFPYFVYNPWVDAAANFFWLKTHMPAGCKTVAIDIEVAYFRVSPAQYAGEVNKFIGLCQSFGWHVIIYTAEWFLNKLSKWPRLDYWWAQYPYPLNYIGTRSSIITWEALKTGLDILIKPYNFTKIPGPLKMWQFSGDYFILPGTTRKIDLNLFYGSEKELQEWVTK
jgi:GH25 family lysozyme M1 (1,4-beta-N-acetylmuramidase)